MGGHILRDEKELVRDAALQAPARTVHNDFAAGFREVPGARFVMLVRLRPLSPAASKRRPCRVVISLADAAAAAHPPTLALPRPAQNVWRSITPYPCVRLPLAVCDRRTVRQEDLIVRALQEQGGHRITTAAYDPAHEWAYFPELRQDEALVFVTYDSAPEGGVYIPTLHTAVELPGSAGRPPRESCEMRVACVLPLPASSGSEPPKAASPAAAKL
eukprot:SAG22_NODE_209_length_15177_cov_9.282995_14_plen_216_part_00